MLNVLGDVWFEYGLERTPAWHEVMGHSGAKVHLYGKADARPGRKMGHVNFTAATLEEARTAARDCARLLHIATS